MGKLSLELIAESKQLLSALDSAQRSVNKFMDSAKAAGGELGGGVNRALESFEGIAKGGAAAAGVFAGALTGVAASATYLAVQAGKNAEELTQLSSKLGIGTNRLQEYEVLLNRTGLSGEDLAVMFKTLSTNVEQARIGVGNAGDRFRQLGIDINKVTSTDQLIRQIADSTARFANGAGKAAIFADLLGKAGLRFIPAFEHGGAALDDAAKASERIGAALSSAQIETLSSMDDSIDDMTLAWKRFSDQIGAFVAPALKMVVDGITVLLAFGSDVFKSLNTAADTMAIRFTHLALAINEVAATLFSENVTSGEAWSKVAANIALIDDEAAKLIAKRRALDEVVKVATPKAQPPPLVDTQKAMAQAQALADAQMKFSDNLFRSQSQLASERMNSLEASLDQQKSLFMATDLEIAKAHQAAAEKMSEFTIESIQTQIRNYARFMDFKNSLFGNDAKGQAEQKKFQVESTGQFLQLLNQLEVAQEKSNAVRIQMATRTALAIRAAELQPLDDEIAKYQALDAVQQQYYKNEEGHLGASEAARRVRFSLIDAEAAKQRVVIEQTIADEQRRAQALINLDEQVRAKRMSTIAEFPTFFERQMQAVTQSNAFSIGQMVSTWTSGISNIILNHGKLVDIVKASEQLLLNASLNTVFQWAAESALAYSRDLALKIFSEQGKASAAEAATAAQLTSHQSLETAKTAITTTQEGARLAVVLATNKAMAAASVSAIVAMGVVGNAALALMEVALQAVVGFLLALAASVVGIPIVGQVLAGTIIVGATLAEFTGNAALVAATTALNTAIGTAIAGTGSLFGMDQGGIATSPMAVNIAEKGYSEAVIPLNQRGASFVRDAFGAGGLSQGQTIVIEFDGTRIMEYTSNNIIPVLRMKGLPV